MGGLGDPHIPPSSVVQSASLAPGVETQPQVTWRRSDDSETPGSRCTAQRIIPGSAPHHPGAHGETIPRVYIITAKTKQKNLLNQNTLKPSIFPWPELSLQPLPCLSHLHPAWSPSTQRCHRAVTWSSHPVTSPRHQVEPLPSDITPR